LSKNNAFPQISPRHAYSDPDQMSRVSQFFASQYQRFKQAVSQIRDTPHAIAGGVAIGVIFGFTPLFGFKTLLAILVAWLFRCSKLSAVMAVTLHDILLPLGPFLLRWQFQIGFFIISRPHRLPPKLSPKRIHFDDLLNWRSVHLSKTLHVLWPTFIGSLVIGIPIAILMYFLVLEIVTRAHAAKARQLKHGPHPPNASQ
jgi:uncharacterized protein (DUF2062 family)